MEREEIIKLIKELMENYLVDGLPENHIEVIINNIWFLEKQRGGPITRNDVIEEVEYFYNSY